MSNRVGQFCELTGKGLDVLEGTMQLPRDTELWPLEMAQGTSHLFANPKVSQRSFTGKTDPIEAVLNNMAVEVLTRIKIWILTKLFQF